MPNKRGPYNNRSITDADRKALKRERDKVRNRRRICIGNAIDKWHSVREEIGVISQEEFARILLESFKVPRIETVPVLRYESQTTQTEENNEIHPKSASEISLNHNLDCPDPLLMEIEENERKETDTVTPPLTKDLPVNTESKKVEVKPDPQKVLQPDPQKVLQPDPQKVLQPDPQKVLQPDPQKVLQPDPQKVLQLDPQKVLQELCKLPGINASDLTGLNPSELVVLDPGQVKGFDPSQAYRAVYIPEGRCLSQLLDFQQDLPEPEEFGSKAIVPERILIGVPESQFEDVHEIPATPPTSITEGGENFITSLEALNKLLLNIEDIRKLAAERLIVAQSDIAHCRYKMMFITMCLESFVNEMSLNLSQCVSSMIDAVQLQQTQYLKFTQGVKKLQQQQASLREEMDKIDSLKMENSQLCRRIKVMLKQRQNAQICGINQNSRKRPKWLDFYQQTLFKYCKRTERRDLMKFQKAIQKVKGKCLSLSLIKDSSSLCKKYTGIPNYFVLKSLLSELIANSDNLSTPVQSDQSDRKRILILENEFFLTLLKIKLDLPVTHLSRQFKVRPGVVREILYKWTPVLIRTMEKLKQDPEFKSITQFWTLLKRFSKKSFKSS